MKDLHPLRVLGIETSCDETAAAIFCEEKGIIANALKSQIQTHERFGGVVPELASRDHAALLLPLVEEALKTAQMSLKDIDAIAYTAAPGLIGGLLVGSTFALSLGFAANIPVIPVHHMEAHLLAPFLEEKQPQFPFVVLLISGGHTQLYLARGLGDYELLGETLDDAVGEAFDKTAKLLGLPYPGGPHLAKLADSVSTTNYKLSIPLQHTNDFNFSFSGLKTQVMLTWKSSLQDEKAKGEIALAFQKTAIETLLLKTKRALNHVKVAQLVIAGGVSANQYLRQRFGECLNNTEIFFPRVEFSTDNAAMVAYCGYRYFEKKTFARHIQAYPRWPLGKNLS